METSWEWIIRRPEGQFLERKSCYQRKPGTARPRSLKDCIGDVAESLVAMANADGGAVVLGVEDDGTITGIPERYSLERVRQQLGDYIQPRLQVQGTEIQVSGKTLWVFSTDWSPEVHHLTDGSYLLRINDRNVPFPADRIEAIKLSRRYRLAESQYFPEASLLDLDMGLVHELCERAGRFMAAEQALAHYRLAEPVNGRWRITLAALLLFAKDAARWHPRCGIEFVRWRGNERLSGAEFNVVKRIRFEAPLLRLIEQAFEQIQQQIPERHYLAALFFEERLEYPAFAWQEAIVNAVAHRDYSLTGSAVEVHLFDNRMEVRSPGGLIEPVTLDHLRRRERIHASRNPRIVRVLVDFGYMRELGEGIPRMYQVMEGEGLRPPEFSVDGGCFVTTLYSEPVYRPETMNWLRQYEGLGLSSRQIRLLAFAREHGGRFTSREYQRLANIGVYEATRDIQQLRRKGIIHLATPRGRIYVVTGWGGAPRTMPQELLALKPVLDEKGYVKNEDICKVLNLEPWKARRVAQMLVDMGRLVPEGEKRGRRYIRARNIE